MKLFSKLSLMIAMLIISSSAVAEPSKCEAMKKCGGINKSEATNTFEPAACEPVQEDCCCINDIQRNSLKLRGAAFFPEGSLTRDIYSQTWPEGSIEYNHLFSDKVSFFLNGAYTGASGRSIGSAHKTTITMIPMTLGVNAWFGQSDLWHPYVGIGAGAAYAHMHNYSSYVKQKLSYWGFSCIVQGGLELDLSHSIFLDLFADYRFNVFSFNRHSSRGTGGADVGGGLGFRF